MRKEFSLIRRNRLNKFNIVECSFSQISCLECFLSKSDQSEVMCTTNFILSKIRNLEAYCKIVRYKSFNSHEWLKRRESDEYIEKAKVRNYRCRSAFKLLEVDDKYKLLRPGLKVLDVGAAPGSWSQVLSERTNSHKKDPGTEIGLVIAVDLKEIHPIEGVIVLSNSDFTLEATQRKILDLLGEPKQFDCVFSDMAPPSTGVKALDQESILQLTYPVIVFSVKHLRPGGTCLIKLWESNFINFKIQVARFFKHLNFVRPAATYTSSSEVYLLGRGFLGLKT